MAVKRQHYVPQFYLKNFSKNDNNLVDVYFKNHKKIKEEIHVKTICYKDYYYDLDDNNLILEKLAVFREYYKSNYSIDIDEKINKNPQYIETVFLNNLETESSNLIKTLLKSSNGFQLQDIKVRAQLTLLFFNLHERSPFKRDSYSNIHTQMKDAFNNFSPKIRNELNKRYSSSPKETQIKNMISFSRILEDSAEAVFNYEWTLAVIDSEKEFITSDNPSAIFQMKEFCFPISTDKAILIRPKDPNQRNFFTDRKNKKFITKFSDKNIFINNILQDTKSEILIGNSKSIKNHIALVKKLAP